MEMWCAATHALADWAIK